jgi:cytochrome c6
MSRYLTLYDRYYSQQAAQGAATIGAAAVIATQPVFAADVAAGEQVFNANCAACHAGGQNVIMPEKTLEKEALEQYLAGGRNEKAVINQVTNGKNAMPAFGGRLGDDEIANVAAYVISSSEAGWE